MIIRPACYAGLLLAIAYITIVAAIIISFPNWVAHFFFTKGSYEFELLLSVIGLIVAFQFLDSIRKVITNLLVVLKAPKFPLLAEVVGLWGVSLPLGYMIGIIANEGITGFLIGLVIGLFISILAMLIRFRTRLITVIGEFN